MHTLYQIKPGSVALHSIEPVQESGFFINHPDNVPPEHHSNELYWEPTAEKWSKVKSVK